MAPLLTSLPWLCLSFQPLAALRPRARTAAPARSPSVAMLAPPQLDALEEEDARPPFDFERSVELASLAFHTYNPVVGGKLERGSDTTNVAFQRANFVSECYDGVLVVTVDRIRGLPKQAAKAGAGEALLTGGALDPYALLSIIEGRKQAGGDDATLPARDTCRTRTMWRMGEGDPKNLKDKERKAGGFKNPFEKENDALEFGETLYLYVNDLQTARLRVTLADENVAKDDDTLGSASLPLESIFPGVMRSGEVSEATTKLVVKYNAPVGPGVAAGAVAGGMFGGPVGAGLGAAAAAIAGSWMRDATVELSCRYVRFKPNAGETKPGAAAMQAVAASVAMEAVAASAVQMSAAEKEAMVERAIASAKATLKARRDDPQIKDAVIQALANNPSENVDSFDAGLDLIPVENLGALGATEGIDWTTLGGGRVNPRRFELIAFIDNSETDTQATLWRDASARELILSFRGTEQTAWKDLMIDAMVMQQPWSLGGAESSGSASGFEPYVHAGFRTAWASVAPRVRELIAGAIGARAFEADARARALRKPRWTLYCTGHSLGGALATLAALELGQSALPFSRIALYTYGAPRVGNADLCALVDSYVPEAFRIVNGQDLVTRMPRGAAADTLGRFAGGILDYRHPGRTVLVDEREPLCAVAGAGLERECPLELLDSPFADPLSRASAMATGAVLDTTGDGMADARLLPALEQLLEAKTGASAADVARELDAAAGASVQQLGETASSALAAMQRGIRGLEQIGPLARAILNAWVL